MKKKEFLTEAKRKAIITDKEKAIIESFAKTFNKIKRIDENELDMGEIGRQHRSAESGINPEKGEDNLNSEINFDRIFDEIFSMEPEYDYDESSSGRLSGRYGGRNTSDGDTTATFHNDELSISLTISYSNHWEEDPDGAGYWGNLSMSYENWVDFGDAKLDDMLTKFGEMELIKNPNTGYGGTSVEEVKRYNMINTEFMNLLSDKTKEKLYNQIELLIDENAKHQGFDDY